MSIQSSIEANLHAGSHVHDAPDPEDLAQGVHNGHGGDQRVAVVEVDSTHKGPSGVSGANGGNAADKVDVQHVVDQQPNDGKKTDVVVVDAVKPSDPNSGKKSDGPPSKILITVGGDGSGQASSVVSIDTHDPSASTAGSDKNTLVIDASHGTSFSTPGVVVVDNRTHPGDPNAVVKATVIDAGSSDASSSKAVSNTLTQSLADGTSTAGEVVSAVSSAVENGALTNGGRNPNVPIVLVLSDGDGAAPDVNVTQGTQKLSPENMAAILNAVELKVGQVRVTFMAMTEFIQHYSIVLTLNQVFADTMKRPPPPVQLVLRPRGRLKEARSAPIPHNHGGNWMAKDGLAAHVMKKNRHMQSSNVLVGDSGRSGEASNYTVPAVPFDMPDMQTS